MQNRNRSIDFWDNKWKKCFVTIFLWGIFSLHYMYVCEYQHKQFYFDGKFEARFVCQRSQLIIKY